MLRSPNDLPWHEMANKLACASHATSSVLPCGVLAWVAATRPGPPTLRAAHRSDPASLAR
jgi:hypothetical protein